MKPKTARVHHRGCLAAALVFGLAARAWSAEASASPVPDFRFDEPFPEVVEAAEQASIPLEGIEGPSSRRGLTPGDRLAVLISLSKGDEMKQWLLELRADSLTDEEKKLPPLPGAHLYSSTGLEFDYAGERAPIRLRVIGPFEKDGGGDADDKSIRVPVNSAYLALGFDRACAADLRIGETLAREAAAGHGTAFGFGGAYVPFPPEQVRAGREMARTAGLTPRDERAFLGTLPALFEFFHIARRAPGMQGIMLRLIDIPWWSILAHAGKAPEVSFNYLPRFREIDPGPWKLSPASNAYALAFVLQLNGKPSLTCQLAVTDPQPPLLTSAGIVGLAAQSPDGTGARLMMRVVSARLGASPVP